MFKELSAGNQGVIMRLLAAGLILCLMTTFANAQLDALGWQSFDAGVNVNGARTHILHGYGKLNQPIVICCLGADIDPAPQVHLSLAAPYGGLILRGIALSTCRWPTDRTVNGHKGNVQFVITVDYQNAGPEQGMELSQVGWTIYAAGRRGRNGTPPTGPSPLPPCH